MFKPVDLFDLSQSDHAAIFDGCEHAWEALARIGDYLNANLKPGLFNQCKGVAWVGVLVWPWGVGSAWEWDLRQR